MTLIARIIDCNHWLGEEPYDTDRIKEIDKVVPELRCGELENDQSTVLKQYHSHPAVEKAIEAAKKIVL